MNGYKKILNDCQHLEFERDLLEHKLSLNEYVKFILILKRFCSNQVLKKPFQVFDG